MRALPNNLLTSEPCKRAATDSNEAGQYLDSSVSQLFAGWNFNERWGVQFNLPVISRSFERPEGFEIVRDTEFGISDASLVGHVQPFRKESKRFTFAWTVLGGVKFPTGSTRRLAPRLPGISSVLVIRGRRG